MLVNKITSIDSYNKYKKWCLELKIRQKINVVHLAPTIFLWTCEIILVKMHDYLNNLVNKNTYVKIDTS